MGFHILSGLLPEIGLAALCIVGLVWGALKKDRLWSSSYVFCACALIAAFAVVLFDVSGDTGFPEFVINNDFTRFMKAFVLVFAVCVVYFGEKCKTHCSIVGFEFPFLLLFAVVGMLVMVSANNLMYFYVGLELQSLSLYVMAAYTTSREKSNEAGVKYFVLGALASAIFLFGCTLVYGSVGSVGFVGIAEYIEKDAGGVTVGLVAGLLLVIAGLAFKISAVPFHMWAPDVYEGSAVPVTAFFASVPKLAAFAIIIRILIEPFGALSEDWQPVIIMLSVASMLVGAFAAVYQKNLMRLIAYSSIANVGFMLIGVATASQNGVRGVLIYLVIYILTALGVFACLLNLRLRGRFVEFISDLSGLSKTSPFTAIALAVFMFSFAGIPPLAGFFGKFYVLIAAVEAGLYTLAVIGVLSSVVSAFYYLRVVKIMYFDESAEAVETSLGVGLKFIMGGVTVLVVGFVFYLVLLVDSAGTATASLFAAI